MPLHPLHRSSLLLSILLASATEEQVLEEDRDDFKDPLPPSRLCGTPLAEDTLAAPPKKELRLPRSKKHRQEQKGERRSTAKKKAKRGW